MLVLLLGLFRLVWLFGKDHPGVVLENLDLRQQISIYKRKRQRPASWTVIADWAERFSVSILRSRQQTCENLR